jgi:hypothetical protein
MLFKKLFRLLVLGGAMVGSASGCAGPAQGQAATDKKGDDRDGGSPADGGTASAQGADGGAAADAGTGGGVQGW